MKSRDGRDVLSVLRLSERYKLANFSLNNKTTLQWKRNTKINVPKKELQLK